MGDLPAFEQLADHYEEERSGQTDQQRTRYALKLSQQSPHAWKLNSWRTVGGVASHRKVQRGPEIVEQTQFVINNCPKDHLPEMQNEDYRKDRAEKDRVDSHAWVSLDAVEPFEQPFTGEDHAGGVNQRTNRNEHET